MKKTTIITLLIFLILISAGFLTTTQAAGDDTSCYLEASVDVFVAVWNVDDGGNKGYLIWKGVVKPGKPKLIRTFDGQMRAKCVFQPQRITKIMRRLKETTIGGVMMGKPLGCRDINESD
jgi:hypothetical protein